MIPDVHAERFAQLREACRERRLRMTREALLRAFSLAFDASTSVYFFPSEGRCELPLPADWSRYRDALSMLARP